MPTKIVEQDLSREPCDVAGPEGYPEALVLARWRERVLGCFRVRAGGGLLDASSIRREAHFLFPAEIASCVAEDMLPAAWPRRTNEAAPSCTVVVCTRDRPDDLRRCLAALRGSLGGGATVLVVDNASSDGRTAAVAGEFGARCVLEARIGLNWARARGAEEAEGGIVAYIDDDAAPGTGWLSALLAPFANPEVAAVTGLVLPAELETAAQERFERHCGFSRGFRRKEYDASVISPLAAANIGAGACMAFRRDLVTGLGLFRAELDCGTATRSGGDTYAFYRLISLGHRIVYTPDAFVWHRHRRTERELRSTLAGYSVGTYAFLSRALVEHGEISALHVGLRWFFAHHVRQLVRRLLLRPGAQPLSLTLAEIGGVAAAPAAYLRSRKEERRKLAGLPTRASAVSEAAR